jgi:type IV pilus assembly protein PilY1
MGRAESGRQVYALFSVPASRVNGVYAGEYFYMGMFKPEPESGRWRGNLKKYQLDPYGRLLDKNNLPATDTDGLILTSAQSYWSEVVDGNQVDLGGAGAFLVDRGSRNLYTYQGGADTNLTAPVNAFSISNKDNIALSVLGVADDDERQAVINDIHGVAKEWVMGDVLHFEPTVVYYDTNGDNQIDTSDDALIYVGTNGGVMHAFSDSNGEELWGFIPPQQLGRLKLLSDKHHDHEYFIDGPPAVMTYEIDGAVKKTLVLGERRGGSNYYALDITTYNEPIWMYRVGNDILGEDGEPLGQSWGRPQFATIATGSTGSAEVLLLPGGYDTNQDAKEPADTDTKGRAVFSVIANSGMLGSFKFYNDGENSDMNHCIVDLAGVDADVDGMTDSIYAPDLGGNMFAFTDADKDGDWEKLRFFDASGDGIRRKIFHSPDVVIIHGDPDPGDEDNEERVGQMIYFGTGDRAHPLETKVSNRFYAVKNYWWDADNFSTLTETPDVEGKGGLHNATDNLIVQGTTEEMAAADDEIRNRMGWYIELEGRGEKVVSSPVVFNRTVYFTTYIPPGSKAPETDNDCDGDNLNAGEARLYGLDYMDARSVHGEWSDVIEYHPETGAQIKSGGKADRYTIIGRSMPSAPMITVRRGVAMLYVEVGGKLVATAPKRTVEMNMYYWRELKQ